MIFLTALLLPTHLSKADPSPLTEIQTSSFVAPPVFHKKPRPVEILRGFDVHLECELRGTAPFQVSWYKDKREIRSSKKYKILAENQLASLHILNVDAADMGEYHCKAVNDVGSDTCVGSVTLKGL